MKVGLQLFSHKVFYHQEYQTVLYLVVLLIPGSLCKLKETHTVYDSHYLLFHQAHEWASSLVVYHDGDPSVYVTIDSYSTGWLTAQWQHPLPAQPRDASKEAKAAAFVFHIYQDVKHQ